MAARPRGRAPSPAPSGRRRVRRWHSGSRGRRPTGSTPAWPRSRAASCRAGETTLTRWRVDGDACHLRRRGDRARAPAGTAPPRPGARRRRVGSGLGARRHGQRDDRRPRRRRAGRPGRRCAPLVPAERRDAGPERHPRGARPPWRGAQDGCQPHPGDSVGRRPAGGGAGGLGDGRAGRGRPAAGQPGLGRGCAAGRRRGGDPRPRRRAGGRHEHRSARPCVGRPLHRRGPGRAGGRRHGQRAGPDLHRGRRPGARRLGRPHRARHRARLGRRPARLGRLRRHGAHVARRHRVGRHRSRRSRRGARMARCRAPRRQGRRPGWPPAPARPVRRPSRPRTQVECTNAVRPLWAMANQSPTTPNTSSR